MIHQDFSTLLDTIVSDKNLHARWLNTLSLMENTGARKISASESKTGVTLMVLKHAAEEARHAYVLKKQISRVDDAFGDNYSPDNLLAPWDSMAYLDRLDVAVCRYLRQTLGLEGQQLKYAAYLLVTYAIEVRADELYPVYQTTLEKHGSRVNVRSIIAEEEGHLAEMLHQMQEFFEDWHQDARFACEAEGKLFSEWVKSIGKSLAIN